MRRLLLSVLLLLDALVATGALVPAAGAATKVFPTVTGGFGTTPTIKFPSETAPTSLETKVLVQGKGATVKKGDLLIANYVGQIWNGKVFDSSFSRNEVFGVPIGVGDVVKGWDDGIVGQKVGSRLLLVIPPSLGYGTTGNTDAGITGKDVIVFVIDVVSIYTTTAGDHESDSVVRSSSNDISVKNLGAYPLSVSVAKAAKKPTKVTTTLLARGSGAKVVAGELVLQYVVVNWTNQTIISTWASKSPDGEYVGAPTAGLFDPLIGYRVGSRLLMEIPESTEGGPYALAVQIAAEVPKSVSKA